MNNRDFETLAGSIPFPASDIAADYSPVEKERIEGPITRSLVVPVHKGPLGGKVPIVSPSGRVLLGANPLVTAVTFPVAVINVFPFIFEFDVPDYTIGALFFMISLPNGAAPQFAASIGIADDAGNEYFYFGTGAFTSFPYKYIDAAHIINVPFFPGKRHRFQLSNLGDSTQVSVYLQAMFG